MASNSHRSIRKLIVQKLPEIAETAETLTYRSLNHQPEYFLSLKVAEAIHEHFKGYVFSMEVNLQDICENVGIALNQLPLQYRIQGLKRADLVIRSSKSGRYRHVIEFKRGVKESNLMQDARRLAWLCQNVDLDHKMNKNFLVTITTSSMNVLNKRSKAINEMLNEEFPDVSLKPEYIDLSAFKSSRPKGKGKPLQAMVWEFHYQ
mgnify:CR=1 FL=1